MKFSITLGLLFAGLAHSQLAQPKQTSLDTFLRESQHLKPSAELVSIKEQGPIATVTYQDGPVNFKYDVKSDGNDMKVVGIEQVMTFSGNFQFNPSNIPRPNIQIDQLPPLPLMMPQFTIQNNGQVQMRNVFDRVEKQIMQMQQRMQQNRFNFQHQMERKRQQMREKINKQFNIAKKQTPLIGSGDHDFNWATSEIEIQPNQPLIGGGDHDMNWATLQFQNEHPLIGGGDHDIWKGQPVDFEADHPIVGGDGHDDWQNKKKRCHKNLNNEGIIGGDDHDNWKEKKHHGKKHHKQEKKEKRHHSNVAWMNRQFTAEQITPYLANKLPDLMSESQIISVEQKGFCKGKGFKLDIQLQDKQGQLQSVSVYFRPMKEELSIEKITKVKKDTHSLETGKELIFDLMNSIQKESIKPAIEIENQNQELNEEKIYETDDLVAPSQVPEQPKPFLLGGENDPDHEVDFMKMPQQIEVHQDNHISEHKEQEVYQVPLLEDQKDYENVEKKEEEKVQQAAMPGGKSDPDQKLQKESPLESAMKIIEDILQQEQLDDIDADEEVQKVEQAEEEEKRSQIKEKLQLLTHRR